MRPISSRRSCHGLARTLLSDRHVCNVHVGEALRLQEQSHCGEPDVQWKLGMGHDKELHARNLSVGLPLAEGSLGDCVVYATTNRGG